MSVRRAVRGVTTAVHTDTQILHSAAVVDFIGWVRTLVENGHMEDAAELWDSVAEVVHMPVPESPLREFASLPPMRRIPCCVEDCTRCREQRGGFRFPWLGVWSRRSLVVQPGMSPSDAWMALGERQELMDIMLVEVYASGFYLRDLMPVAWDGMVSRAVEAPGCARVSTVFRMFRHWQLGHELWRDSAVSMATRAEARRSDRGRAQRAMAEWLEFVVDYPDLHIPATCALCGSLTRHLCVGCLVSFCPTCTSDRVDPLCCAEALASGDMRLEMPALPFGENTGRIIQHSVRQNLPLVQRGGPEGRGLWGLLAAGVVMQSWQHSPPQCMDDQEGPGGHWPACEAVALVEAGRVAAWRDENGLQDDGDFAFRFSSWEQAVAGAGHVVAMAWLQARQSATDGMLQGVDRALQAAPSLPPRVPVPTSAKISMRRAPVRLKENVLASPEAIVRRVDSLAAVWIRLGALRPGGELTPSLRADWEASCRRLAQAMVTASEPVTISNALMTVSELETWMQARQRNLPPGLIDLDNFVHQGTPAPTRSLNALRWLSKHGDLAWPLHRVTVPAVKVSKKKKGQAVVVGPPMLGYLEEQIEGLFKAGDQTWSALLGSWLVAVGVLRYKHISRSVPKKVSLSTFHAHCPRGKQRRLRGGFDFCIPATFTSGWNWTGPWLELWKKLPVEQKGRCGLCFDSHGVAWDLTEVHRQARICFRNQVETPELMTSYSWRRLMPTVGHLLQFQPASLAALGDWQEKKDEEPSTKMALRYSSARYQESTRVKHLTLAALSQLQGFEAWEMICPENVEEAKSQAERVVNQALHRDGHLVWSTPITASEVAVRFALTTRMKERAAALRRESRHTRAVRSMPDVVNGRQMSSFLRDGGLLCGEYQVEKCTKSEEECGAMHRCGVLLRTGRVCGGRHPGLRCYDKRANREATSYPFLQVSGWPLSIQPYSEEAGRAKGGATS